MRTAILIILCFGFALSPIYGQTEIHFKGVDWTKRKLEFSGLNMHGFILNDSSRINNYYPLYHDFVPPTFNKFHFGRFSGINLNQLSYRIGSKINLTPFSENVFYLGVGEINNMGLRTRLQLSNYLFLEGGMTLSKQDNYMLHHGYISPYFNLRLNYIISPKLSVNIKSQYVLKRNSNLFMSQFDYSPKTSLMIGAEYKPSTNVKMQIGAGVQEDILKKNKYQFVIEGKTSIVF